MNQANARRVGTYVLQDSDTVHRMNDTHVTQARAELATALNDATLVDDLPLEEANSYEGRRAKWRARVALEAAQVHATLALVEAYSATVVPKPQCVRTNGIRCPMRGVEHGRVRLIGDES